MVAVAAGGSTGDVRAVAKERLANAYAGTHATLILSSQPGMATDDQAPLGPLAPVIGVLAAMDAGAIVPLTHWRRVGPSFSFSNLMFAFMAASVLGISSFMVRRLSCSCLMMPLRAWRLSATTALQQHTQGSMKQAVVVAAVLTTE